MNFSGNLKSNTKLFKLLSTIKGKPLKAKLLKQLTSDDEFNQALREIAFNIVQQNRTLSKSQKRSLQPHAKKLSLLSLASSPKKRKRVIQTGRGLPLALIPIALTLINELAS